MKQKLFRRLTNGKSNISVFWKHMFMMLCILLICLIAIGAVNQLSLQKLTEEHAEKLRNNLARDCASLAEQMDASRYIPNAVEDSKYYKYISNINSGTLPENKYLVLSLLQDSLHNQLYLQQGSDLCVLYHMGSNSLISTNRNQPVAEDFFSRYLLFSETSTEEIMAMLKESSSTHIIPMQEVRVEIEKQPHPRMALILHPANSKLAVMTVFSENFFLNQLDFAYMPSDTHLEIHDNEGRILMQYPHAPSESVTQNSHRLSGELDRFGIEVTLWIPNTYFNELLQPVRFMGIAVVLLVTLLGLILTVFFSRASVEPIRRLIHAHTDPEVNQPVNEIAHLDKLLSGAQQKNERVRELLVQQILSRALSGAILSESDERILMHSIPFLTDRYRVAILHTTEEVNGIVGEYLSNALTHSVWTLLNDKETGILFAEDETSLHILEEQTEHLIHEIADGELLCGVSGSAAELPGLSRAAQQARLALPQTSSLHIYAGEHIEHYAISWLQHQRLYQSIYSCNEEDALRLLQSITQQTDHSTAHEVYYNICFVLRSVAEEMSVRLPDELLRLEYRSNLLPQENISSLQPVLRELFLLLREKDDKRGESRNMELENYIRQHFQDYDICAASVAEQFGISERLVYDLVRKQTGMSFNAYVTSLRMNMAAGLLYTTNTDIREISQRCGYRILNTFYRVFKAQYGMSPGQYRDTGSQEKTSSE